MASSKLTGTLSLKRFMLRSEVLRLYRDMMRVVKRLPSSQQAELRQWIRTDFDNNKHHTDEEVIRMMITKGRMSLKELEQSVTLAS
ncbi:LYR motif-containing protein 2-like [Babylonia areolata]|uniref:LYR motif-containing protein 2-like n=1 Tax=Babylonia areolata TaxID=304850 RepID=UPI003FCFBF1A